jgi:hypothetical protein
VTNYIKVFIERTIQCGGRGAQFEVLRRKLERLDPRDFEPEAQADFMMLLADMSMATQVFSTDYSHTAEYLRQWLPILDRYRGADSGGVSRRFPYLSDPDLQSIVERDYIELRLKLFPSGAWKSSVIMAGSMLEAILFDRLADPKWNPRAVASAAAHTKGTTPKSIPIKDWRLENLIDIAVEIKLLPSGTADTIHQVLRDYPNFVHPKKEIRAAHSCTEAEAMLSLGALDSVCNYIEKHP